MSNDITAKARENRASRAARRQGMILVKSRRRDPNADGYGSYVLVEDRPDGRTLAAEILADGEGVSLDAIEAFLNWTDVFVVDPGVSTDAIDFIGEAPNRVILTHIGGHGWQALVLNDGNPLDHSPAGKDIDTKSAVDQAQKWARDYFRLTESIYRRERAK